MATVRPLASPAAEAEPGTPAGLSPEGAAEQALIATVPEALAGSGLILQGPLSRLPVELDVAVPVEDFRVRNLLALEPGQVIETRWANGRDMPLCSGEVQLAWSEFEVIDAQLAVRVTQLV